MKKQTALDTWLSKAQSLRADAEAAEVRFYMHLLDGEALRDMWCGTFMTFEVLLKETALADPARYSKFRAAMRVVSAEDAAKVGIDAVIAAARVSESKRGPMLVASERWTAEHGGVHPSKQTVDRMAQSIDPIERQPLVLRREMGDRKMREEVVALRRRVTELEKENESLKKKLASHSAKRLSA